MSSKQFATPQEAEDAFYRAFAVADVDAMMAVWAEDDAVTCIHPAGPRLDGRPAIRHSWQAIFHQASGIGIWQRLDQHRADDAEHGRVSSDAER